MKDLKKIDAQKYQSKNYDKTIDLVGDYGDNCIYCGKRQNDSKGGQKYVHLITTGEFVNVAHPDEDGMVGKYESQGWFPIGNTCAKKFPKEFVFINDTNNEKLN